MRTKQQLVSFIISSMLLFFLTVTNSMAETSINKLDLTAPEAYEAQRNQQLKLIDIRTPQEWQQTGIPAGAVRVNMAHPDGKAGFINALLTAIGGNKNQPIAVICRTGSRSALVQQVLIEEGFAHVMNVPEGIIGSSAGPGWLQRKLPIEQVSN
ncbi:rhodanese-like domain-containing protein [Thiospirillum jenense]|uniref:Rhodanese-like domain-containing protein n=1 Tax=Thiospirillum jenense TaxID=1653858 RepID=A0A839HDT9_9GAMM|nr:rhodanese-like domain-containing protein [Thiospirillum jenense]MBB1127095.1 rhodanese-like domain-containing protein [Thiospirillum jenense]